MQVSINDINDQSMFLNRHPSITIQIIYKPNPELEIVPVFKLSGFVLPLSQYLIFTFTIQIWVKLSFLKLTTKMEDTDEHLLIANIEISCWKEQLRQAIS